ncbi:MAG: hypothetical protein IPL26_21905 [Leptospiraceae bacterium]|nr:hypothetical protein [Leptospiraceae bacterium]
MIRIFFLSSILFFLSYCGNEMYVELPSNNQPIRDLVDNDQTKSTTNTYNQPSSLSGTNSSGAVGGITSGAVGTTPGSPATGGATGNYSGNPNPSGY